MKTKTRPWRHIYHDIEIPRPKNHNIEIPRPKNRDIKKQRQLTHDIVVPRHFFRGQKSMMLRFQGSKTTTSRLRSHGIEFPRNSDPYAPWYEQVVVTKPWLGAVRCSCGCVGKSHLLTCDQFGFLVITSYIWL